MKKCRNLHQFFFLFTSVLSLLILAILPTETSIDIDILSNIKVVSQNKCISVTWDSKNNNSLDNVIIDVKDLNENLIDSFFIKPSKEKFTYKSGKENTGYIFTISITYHDGTIKELANETRLFLNMEKLPDIPTMTITTKSGDDPTSDYISAPEGYNGSTKINSDKLEGSMTYTTSEKEIESKLEIKIRGNTSSLGDKKPYKITLDNPLDLLNLGAQYSHKNWNLLASGETLNNYLQQVLGELCGIEWIPHGIYINLFMNGDYKGIYTLCEEVSKSSYRNLISKNGYLFESDAYMWNANGVYFQLDGQSYNMGYTFKYPNINFSDDKRILEIRDYMQNAVNLAIENNEEALNYWDFSNLSSYMIAKDIMCNVQDPAGTNVFYYIKDYESSLNEDRFINIGPLWDSDASFISSTYEDTHSFCIQHDSTWIPIVDSDFFKEAYIKKWDELSNDVLSELYESLDELYSSQGKAINQSRYLNSLRWGDGNYTSIDAEIELAKQWLYDQINWLNDNIGELNNVPS